MSRDDRACLDQAKSRLTAARCVPRLFPDVKLPDREGGACYLPKLTELTAQMCTCRPSEKPCADKVNEAMTRWGRCRRS